MRQWSYWLLSMIPKSGCRFSEKIMLKQRARAATRACRLGLWVSHGISGDPCAEVVSTRFQDRPGHAVTASSCFAMVPSSGSKFIRVQVQLGDATTPGYAGGRIVLKLASPSQQVPYRHPIASWRDRWNSLRFPLALGIRQDSHIRAIGPLSPSAIL